MLGAIAGDVIGSSYEFNNTKDYGFRLFTSESDFTDDTVMSVAVAEWLLTGKRHTHAKLEKIMVKFSRKYPCPMGGYGTGFYNWLFSAGERKPYNSWGNGSAMRVSAVGWFFDTLEETERVAGISADITHNHPEGIKGAQSTAAAIWLARNGKTKDDIRSYIETRYGYDLHRTWEQLHPVYDWDSSCQGTVPEAMIAFLDSTDYEDAIRKAVSLGGDSDTLACITGGIAEAFYGVPPGNISSRVVDKLPEDFVEIIRELKRRTAYRDIRMAMPHMKVSRITPERVTSLKPGQVFCFGSNLSGAHGGGAARMAYEKFGAEWGVGVGPTGDCYAIPTMQGPVKTIRSYVDQFIRYAGEHRDRTFLVTRIGCGIAGFRDEEIAPLFAAARNLENVWLPESFWAVLNDRSPL